MDNIKTKNIYLNIDSSNYFKEASENEKYMINFKSQYLKNINNYDSNSFNNLKAKYIEKYFPDEKDQDNYLLSHHLSRHFVKIKNLKKFSIEKNINYFFNRRISITYSNTFKLDIESMENLGNILSYIFKRLEQYKIKSKKDIKDNIKANGLEVNVLTDFYNYCVDNNLPPNEENKSLFWYKNKKKYNLPPELIFLINLFCKITIFDFDINFQDETFNETQFKYFTLVILNLDLFLNNLKYIKFNFIHEKFQNLYNTLYHHHVLGYMNPDALKINKVKDYDLLYTRKWIFEKNFNLEEHRNIEFIQKQKIKKKNEDKEYGDFTIIQDKVSANFNNYFLQKSDTIINNTDDIDDFTDLDLIDLDFNSKSCIEKLGRSNSIRNSNHPSLNKKNSDSLIHSIGDENRKNYSSFKNAIEKFHYSFEIIFILFNYLSNRSFENIDLIMNDSYTEELTHYFKRYLKIDIKDEFNNFHFLDLYMNTLTQMRSLNIEIDSFDLNTFDKVLYLLLVNTKLKELKISLFTCDINYFPYTLLRTYLFITHKMFKIENSENNEFYLLDKFYQDFKLNLLFLFYLIKKRSLNKLGLNFDIPFVIQKKDDYMVTIMKFIINIFIYLNEESCKINVLTLLSPSTNLNGEIMNNLDKIFEEMELFEKNMYLYELNIQFTIYKLPHIKNIISKNLVTFNIGDLDLPTLESILNYFSSYKFANLSLLRNLGIKLLSNIDYLSPKLKIILRSLFNIKLKNLKCLTLFTNIIIKNKSECLFFMKILKDNWISSYTLIFNKLSTEYIKTHINNNKITFLVPHNLENELIGPEKNNNKNISTNTDDVVYWYLKYIFNNKHYYISKKFQDQKYYIYNILKYLYFIKKVSIFFDLKSSEEEKKK